MRRAGAAKGRYRSLQTGSCVHFTIRAYPDTGLFCRVIGLVAQRSLVAEHAEAYVDGDEMIIELVLSGLPAGPASNLAAKIAQFIGVRSLLLDGVPLDLSG